MKVKILVVEDEFITAADIQGHLQEMGFEVPLTVDNGGAAIEKAGELRPDLILMDITLNGRLTGIEAAEQIRDLYGIPVIYLTAHSESGTLERSLSSNPFGYIVKPFDPSNLRVAIEMALYKHGTEERLRESGRTILALLNSIPDALVLLDRERRIVAVNDGMSRKLGQDRNGLMGSSAEDLISSGSLGISLQDLDLLFRDGSPARHEGEVNGKWYETAMYPIRDGTGGIVRVAIQSHDITDLKQLEERMKTEGLSRIEQNMEQFLILNDQIRNPLQVIRGFVHMSESPFGKQIEEQIRIIDDLVTRLDRGWIESEKVRSFLMRHYWQGDQEQEA